MDIKLRPLRAFAEVVRQGGFSQAARSVFATQSTVSKAVKQLEDDLGIVLLDRTVQPARLTAAGEIVYRRAMALLAEQDDLFEELNELRGLQRGELRLGLPPIGSSLLFAPLFATFRSLYPGIEIRLVEYGSKRLEEVLRAGEIDLAGLLAPVSDEFESQPVHAEPMVALISQQDPLAQSSEVSFSDLASQPFVLFESGFALNPIILDACRERNFQPNVAARTSQIDFMVALVAAGLGVGFLPRMMAEKLRQPGVHLLALREPALEWKMSLAWRRGGFLSHAARAWLDLLAKPQSATPPLESE